MNYCFDKNVYSFRRKKSKDRDNEQSDNGDVLMAQSIKKDEKDITKDNNDESKNIVPLSNACNFNFDEIVSIYKLSYYLFAFFKYIHI